MTIIKLVEEKEAVRKDLLRKLYKKRMFNNKHTSFDNLPKGFPGHLGREVKKAAEELIREGILLTKPTSYGLEVSLNSQKLKEIEEIIGGG